MTTTKPKKTTSLLTRRKIDFSTASVLICDQGINECLEFLFKRSKKFVKSLFILQFDVTSSKARINVYVNEKFKAEVITFEITLF